MAGRRSTITQTGVLIINGQQVENTFNGLKRVVNQYERQLRNLTPGTEEYIRVSQRLREVRERFNEIRQEIQETNRETSRFGEIFSGNVAADFFSNASQKAIEWGSQLKERVEELVKIKSTLSTLDSNLKGANLDRAAASVQAIADTYGKGVEEIQSAVKGLNAQTGDTNKSLDLIKKGFIAGADASGEMLTQLKEYPTMMNDARVSAEEMIAIMAQAEKKGVYDDKGLDAFKEGMLRVREGTKATVDAMKAIGLNTDQIYKKIKDGQLTYFEVLKMVSKKLKDIGADSRLTGTAIADIFGGPGEDAGYKYLSSLHEINTDLNKLTQSTDLAVIAKNKELEANEKLNGVWVQLTGTAGILNRMYSDIKIGLASTLSFIFGIKEAKLSDEYLNQETRLRYLKSQLDNTNVSQERKLQIYQELKSEWPQYFSGLDLEKMKHDEVTKSINRSIDALGRKYKTQVFSEMFDDTSKDFTEKYANAMQLEKKGQDLIGEAFKQYPKLLDNFKFKSSTTVNQLRELNDVLEPYLKKQRESASMGDKVFWSQDTSVQRGIKAVANALASANKESSAADAKRIKDQQTLNKLRANELPDLFPQTPITDTKLGATKDVVPVVKVDKSLENDLEKAKAAYNAALEAKSQSDKKYLELEKNFGDEKFKIIQEGKQKEWDLELKNYDDRKTEIQNQNNEFLGQISKTQLEIEKLQRDKKDTKNPQAAQFFDNAINELTATNKKRRSLIDKNNEIESQIFETHGFNLLKIEEKWETISYEKKVEKLQQKIELDKKNADDSINSITTMEQAKEAISQMQHLKLTETELRNIKTLEDAKKALHENANRAYLKNQENFINDQLVLLQKLINDPSMSPEAIEKLKKDLDELNAKKSELTGSYNAGKESDDKKVSEESDTEKEKIDILGFSAKDWEETWNNLDTTAGKIKGVKMVVQALSNAFQAFSQLQQALAEKEMQKFEKDNEQKKKDLLVQLNQGYINKEEYEKGIQLLDQETARKKAEIAHKQAKTERAIKIVEIITNTSLGIMQAYSQLGPIGGTIAAVLIGTLGAVQLATVANTPLPEIPSYAEGGFHKNGFEGFTGTGYGMPDESGERKAGLAWLHENEWTAPRWMNEHPVYSKKINELEYARKNKIKSFADGGFSSENSAQTPNITKTSNDADNSRYFTIMSNVEGLLQYLKDNGIECYMIENAENGKRIKRTVKLFETVENNAKQSLSRS